MRGSLTGSADCRTLGAMRHLTSKILVCSSLLPIMVHASPDSGETAAVPSGCIGIPASEPLISGLGSGQAMVSGQTVTLRFSNIAYACGETLTGGSTEVCRDDWTFSLTVPSSALESGVYSLSSLAAQFSEFFNVVGPSQGGGCSQASCRMSSNGIGEVTLTDSRATLEIYSVGSQCITGKITGFQDPIFPNSPNHNGAFFASRC